MNRREFITLLGGGGGLAARGARAAASAAGDRIFARHFGFRLDAPSGSVSAGLEADWLRPAIRPCVGEPYATRSIEATRRAKSLPMTDFLRPWPPPSIRGPFAEVAHEAPYHQRGWQVARRNRARSRPCFCQESRYSYGPPCTLLLRDSSKKSVSHYGFGEIINNRCTNTTTRTLSREPANVPGSTHSPRPSAIEWIKFSIRLGSSRIAGAPAQEEIDEPAGKLLRPRSDFGH